MRHILGNFRMELRNTRLIDRTIGRQIHRFDLLPCGVLQTLQHALRLRMYKQNGLAAAASAARA